jgi:Carboxypeptidase regulatory-like domain
MVRRSLTLMLAALVLLAGVGSAQTVAIAQISGVVTDASGAALPGAEVQMIQTATGASRFVVTDARGAYVLANLPTGPYKLEVKLQGFSTYEQTGITLAVGASPAINVTLKLGAIEESVTVVANATMVDLRTTGVGTVITEEQMVGLPLNGRQASQLVLLSGAAVSNGASGALIGSQRQYPSAVAISVAGGTGNSTLYLVDGAYNNDPLNNIGQPMPFPDALQEFKVESGVRPARYGVYPGATVNAVTRSGSNAFHGTAFEFARHHAFNSRGYFDIADDGLVRSQSGGTIGGPIIPNKLFFFAGPQITNERIRPTSTDTFVPTAKMLAGDFTDVMSAACQGGANRTLGGPFTGNRIDPSRFNPIALKIANLLPRSSDPCGRLSFTVPNNSDEIQTVARVDYQLNQDHRVFGRYYVANYDRQASYDGTNVLLATGTGLGLDNRVQTLALGHDWVVTPTLVAATRFSFQKSRILRTQGDSLPTWSQLGADVYSYTHEPGQNFYNLNVTNGWGGPAFPGKFISTTPQVSEDVDWIRGAHSLSFGGMWMRPFEDADGPFQANGTFAFNGTRTGGTTAQDRLGMADFLTGLPSSFSEGGSQIVAEKMHYVGAYIQDVWRVNGRLTVNGGLRWEPYLAAKDQNGFLTAFNMDWFTQNRHSVVYPNAPAGLQFKGDDGFPTNGANTDNRFNQLAPRAGFVWDPSGDNVQTIRAAVGLYYDSPKLWQYGHHMLNAPFGNTVSVTNPSSFANPWVGFPGGNPLPVASPIPSNVTFPLLGTYVSMPVDIHPMQVRQWNVSYQRQFWRNWMVSATYLGNRTNHIWNGVELNPSVYIPGQSTTANVDARRVLNLMNPSQGKYYGSVSQTDDFGSGRYAGLLLSVQKRLSAGWSANTNFTWSKCENDGEPSTDIGNTYPDPNDRTTNLGPCAADRPYISNTSLIYQSPGLGGGLARLLTKDWQVGTVIQARSGSPLTPSTTGNLSLTGLGNQRPLVVGDPELASSTFDQWFNTAAFAPNTPGLWGNTPKGFLRGPAFWNVDLALSRNLGVGQGKHVEVRVECFNVFNHVVPGDPNTTFGNANFGKVTSTGGDPRIMQFAAKFVF